MASQKQVAKWTEEAEKINNSPEYIAAYVEYRTLAKRADQRLTRLEALAYEEHFHGVLEYSYKYALRDIRSWGGNKRFNTAPPVTLEKLQYKIADIEKFLEKPTSTKSAIIGTYKARAETINTRYGNEIGYNFTWEEIANFYESDIAKRDDVAKASKTVVRALATIRRAMTDKDLQNIKDVNERIQRVSSDKVVNNMVEKLAGYGLNFDDLKEG